MLLSILTNNIFIFFLILTLAGCQTMKAVKNSSSMKPTDQQSLRAVAGAMVGKNLTDEEFKTLTKDVAHNPQARSAIESITQSMNTSVKAKYCSVDGKRYAPNLMKCPEHNVDLKVVGE